MSASPTLQSKLQEIGEQFQAVTGTIHIMGADGLLHLVAAVGLPESLRPLVETIPLGKGIAGAAAERREPVTLCNLQTDATGTARPAARSTGVEAAIAVPVLAGDTLVGVLGIGKAEAHTFTEAEVNLLQSLAARLSEDLRSAATARA